MALCQCSPPWALHGVEGALVYPGQIPELAFECHGYGTHGYGIYRYSIIPSPHPRHHPGEFAGELEQENQQRQCFVYTVTDQGQTPRSDFPDLHRLLRGAPISTCTGGQEQGIAVQLCCRRQLQAEVASSFSAAPLQQKY